MKINTICRGNPPVVAPTSLVSLLVAPRGGQIKVNSAKVILADIPARNGTIHGINQVLLPPDLFK